MINSVSLINDKYNFNTKKQVVSKPSVSIVSNDKMFISNIYQFHPSFLGRTDARNIEDTALGKKFVSSDKKIFEFVKTENANPKEMQDFLLAVTKNEKASKSFIEEINRNPKKADEITAVLINKLGGSNNFRNWYYDKNGYQRAYERYFKKEIFENDNVSVDDMVKISPNIMLDAMKLKSLKTTGDTDFTIGEMPSDIGSVEDFRQITKAVRNSQLVKEFVEFRDFMEDLDAFSEKYPEAKENAINPARFAKDFLKSMISGYLKAKTPEEKMYYEQKVPFLKYMKDTQIEVNGKKYIYSPILRPYSTKLLFALQPENTENKYFVTMEMFNDEKKTCENAVNKENSAMRSDSPYLNAVVDFYLRKNGCQNVPDIKFYDYKSNAVLYPFIVGSSEKPINRTDKYGVVEENKALKKEMKPLTDLGIFITDCFYENFMYDQKSGKTMIVDNGHAKYSNTLRPGVKMIHMGFQDLYGRDFVSLDAGIQRATEKTNK